MSDPDIIAAFFTAFGAAKKNGNGKYYFDFSSSQASDAAKYLITVSRNACFMNDNDGTGFAGLRDGSVKAIFLMHHMLMSPDRHLEIILQLLLCRELRHFRQLKQWESIRTALMSWQHGSCYCIFHLTRNRRNTTI